MSAKRTIQFMKPTADTHRQGQEMNVTNADITVEDVSEIMKQVSE